MSLGSHRVPIAVLTAAAASLWLYLYTSHMNGRLSESTDQPELYVTQPRWELFDQHGRLDKRLHAERLEHWSAETGSRLIHPQLRFNDPQQRLWQVDARQGRVYSDNRPILLEQQVVVRRESGGGGLILKTDRLHIADRGDRVETDSPVVLQAGNWHFTSNGLRANLGQQRLELVEGVRGVHE